MNPPAFLQIPPFPGRRGRSLAMPAAARGDGEGVVPGHLLALLRQARVGGTFWGRQPTLPAGRDILLCPGDSAQAREMARWAKAEGEQDRCLVVGRWLALHGLPHVPPGVDPWHVAPQAAQIMVGADQDIALVAAILDVPVRVIGTGRYRAIQDAPSRTAWITGELALRQTYRDPWHGHAIGIERAIAILGEWRSMIDRNRNVSGIYGMARWKRATTDALLWDGDRRVRHARSRAGPGARDAAPGPALAWRSRTSPAVLHQLDRQNVQVGEIEDGMIRSVGLGVNCIAPLSIVVDPVRAHFDPAGPSTLETMLEHAQLPLALIDRARALRQRIVAAGIGKYGVHPGTSPAACSTSARTRRRVLIVGQVEGDRSVLCGGHGLDNHALLRRAREDEPGAEVLYKPHPDVEAGHRKGALADDVLRAHGARSVGAVPLVSLFREVDCVHVLTSLAGFEALLHGKPVVTHGVPFYAGWSLTRDLGPVPARRSRARTIDELVAVALLLYPRYLDPVTRLPCPAEVLVDRLASGWRPRPTLLEAIRKQQGRVRHAVSRIKSNGR